MTFGRYTHQEYGRDMILNHRIQVFRSPKRGTRNLKQIIFRKDSYTNLVVQYLGFPNIAIDIFCLLNIF